MKLSLGIFLWLFSLQPVLAGELSESDFRADLPAGFTASRLNQPESARRPLERTVSIFYYGKFDGGGEPIIVIPGGPGQDSHLSYRNYYAELSRRAPRSPIIFFDPRGTGYSSPYPTVAFPFLRKELARFNDFGAAATCGDILNIGKAVGANRKLKLVGFSYGAAIALKCLHDQPQIISSVIAWGNTMPSTAAEYFQREFAIVQAQVRFFSDRPELYWRIRLNRAKAHPRADAVLERRFGLSFNDVLDASVYRLAGSMSTWNSYAKSLDSALRLAEEFENGSVDEERVLVAAIEQHLSNRLLASRTARIAINVIEKFNGAFPIAHVEKIIPELKAANDFAPLCGECATYSWMEKNRAFIKNIKQVAIKGMHDVDPKRIRQNADRYGVKLEIYVGKDDHLMPDVNTSFLRQLSPQIPLFLLDGGHDTNAFFKSLQAL